MKDLIKTRVVGHRAPRYKGEPMTHREIHERLDDPLVTPTEPTNTFGPADCTCSPEHYNSRTHDPACLLYREHGAPVSLTRPADERRDYNAEELAMIARGAPDSAKIAWHKRTGR